MELLRSPVDQSDLVSDANMAAVATTGTLRGVRAILIAVVAATLFQPSSIANAQSLRINSPRGVGGEVDSGSGGREEGNDSGVLVKLPTDLKAVLDLQKADRRRIHASILSLHPDGGDEQQVCTWCDS